MKSLKQLVLEYKRNPAKIDKEIEEAEKKIIKPVKKKIKPLYHIQKSNPVPVYDIKDVPRKIHHKYIRTLGLEEKSKLKGDIVQLFKNTINGKRFGVKINIL
jgi:hypothetical protein